VRSYGKVVEAEKITLNALCPGIVETSISSPDFYAEAKARGCLVKMDDMMDGFMMFMGKDQRSGECAEVIAKHGARVVEFPAPSKESAIGRDFVIERHRHLND
jgi:NAD(P)-dependent dehydrogenase (short-subunit alcohol dehydrogenase family)